MLNRLIFCLFIFTSFSFNAVAMDYDNPFDKKQVLKVGRDMAWKINNETMQASRSASDSDGTWYHLRFDNTQLELLISNDASGREAKQFSQLIINDVIINGRQSALFLWCLNNQQQQNEYLEQGLQVRRNVCQVDGEAGRFIMQLDKETLNSLQRGITLTFLLKPYRTALELKFDISDFNEMYAALNPAPEVTAVTAPGAKTVASKPQKIAERQTCRLEPPPKYKNIGAVEYDCNDPAGKKGAQAQLNKMLDTEKARESAKEKARQKQLAAEKARQQQLAEQKKLAEELKRKQQLQAEAAAAEAAAIAASKAKQAEISEDIAQKMVSVCEKYWSKGEHRCYCQKYIEYAPAEIRQNANCE